MQIVIATLSTGVVGPGDLVARSNRTLILQVRLSVKNSFRFSRKIFLRNTEGFRKNLKGFFPFFDILIPKNFSFKNIIYKNFSVFCAKPKNFFL
jgi:hypothetical protein